MRALRAYFHFELLRRYNRIVIGDRSFTMQEVNTLVPVSYDDAAGWIVSECDAVIPSLPKTYLGTEKGEVARVTKGMAMALKARMLLYAASPLNNPGGDAGRYLEAAAAAKELIDAGIYKLVSEETTNNADAQGLIFGKWCPVSSDFEAANFPVGFEGGNSGVCRRRTSPRHSIWRRANRSTGTTSRCGRGCSLRRHAIRALPGR